MESREAVTIFNQNQKIFGMLHRPLHTSEAPPLVVFCHGFASNKIGTNRCYVTLAEQLSKAGFASLRFDFRGSGDSEGAISQMTFEDFISDAVAVLEMARTLPGIDSQKIALFGSSLGATVSVFAAARFQKIAAMVLWAPIAEGARWMRDFMQSQAAAEGSNHAVYRGLPIHPHFQREFSQQMAAETLSQLVDVPFLHMHGQQDRVVPICHQEIYRSSCSNHRNATRFLCFDQVDHCMGGAPIFPNVVQEAENWYKIHLMGLQNGAVL